MLSCECVVGVRVWWCCDLEFDLIELVDHILHLANGFSHLYLTLSLSTVHRIPTRASSHQLLVWAGWDSSSVRPVTREWPLPV